MPGVPVPGTWHPEMHPQDDAPSPSNARGGGRRFRPRSFGLKRLSETEVGDAGGRKRHRPSAAQDLGEAERPLPTPAKPTANGPTAAAPEMPLHCDLRMTLALKRPTEAQGPPSQEQPPAPRLLPACHGRPWDWWLAARPAASLGGFWDQCLRLFLAEPTVGQHGWMARFRVQMSASAGTVAVPWNGLKWSEGQTCDRLEGIIGRTQFKSCE